MDPENFQPVLYIFLYDIHDLLHGIFEKNETNVDL